MQSIRSALELSTVLHLVVLHQIHLQPIANKIRKTQSNKWLRYNQTSRRQLTLWPHCQKHLFPLNCFNSLGQCRAEITCSQWKLN